MAAASCSGNSKGGGGSNDSGGEGGEAANPGSGGGGNRGGSAGAGRGGGGGKAGAGGTSFGSGGEGAANHAGGTQGGDAGAVGTGSAGDAGGDGEGGIGGGSGASHGGSAGVTHGEGGAGFGGEPGTGAVSGAGAGGSAGTTGATGGTTGATGGSAGDAGTSGGAGGEPGGAGGEPGGAGGDDAGAGGEGGAGACDHDAVIIAEGDKAWGLALDATHVYFTERALDGSVRRVAKAGGSVETISEGEPFPAAIAVSGQRVFWSVVGTGSGSGQMVEGATTGGSRQALFEEPEHGIFSLVADEEALYYTTYYNVLKRVALEDGAASQVSGGPFNSFIVDVALDAGELYWTNDGVGHFAATEPESAAVHAGPTQVVSRLNFPLFEIAVAGGGIYFNDDEAIHRVGVAGGPTSVVVALPPAARKEESPIADLSADGEFVFYADRDAVYRVPAIGGAPTVVTEGWRAIGKLAADDEYLYFTDNERGAVVRVEKCAVSNGTASTNPVDAPPAVAAVEPPACTGEPGPHGCPEPEVIETIASPYGLALDASHVYYSTYGTSGSIRREPLGGGEPLVIAPNEVRAHDIAVTDEYVLWSQLDTTAGHLAKAPKTGGARTPLATGVGSYGVGRVTSDGTFAYYVTGFNSIYRVALAGGPWSIVAAGPFGSNAVDVALFDGELFWANDGLWNSNFTAKLANTAYTAKAHAAGSTTLSGFTLDAPLDYPLYRIAVDANAVYYIDDALLYRVSRSGGEVTELGSIAPASGVIVDLETDGQNLYFADLTSVYRMPVTGGDVVTLTSGWAGLRTIAVNADSLYFTDFTGGAVLRMPK